MGKLDRHVTISDVAALAGVSVGTASKALNGRGSLREETRTRVKEAARRLNFEINAGARSLHSGRTYTVGMITTDTIGRFSIPVLMGAEEALGAGQMSVFLCDGRDDPIRERYHLKTLLSRRVDGIIVTGRRTQARPPLAPALPIPVVYAFTHSTDPADCSVLPDEAAGARKAIDHLLAIGRTRIAHVTGPDHHHSAQIRATATTEHLARTGHQPAGPPLFGAWSELWGRQAVGILLAAGTPFDAVFCGSDQIARGVADALRAVGRRVPDDVALVGFDNWDVMTDACQPPLTSIDMNLEGLGRTAAQMLLAAINGAPAPGRHLRPCELVIRESTMIPLTPPAASGTFAPAIPEPPATASAPQGPATAHSGGPAAMSSESPLSASETSEAPVAPPAVPDAP